MRTPTPRILQRTAALLLSGAILALPAATPSLAAQTGGGTVRIGVIEMLSGSGAFYGNAVLDGIKVAQKELNNKGGILGKPIELAVQDNASDDAQTTTLMKQMAQDSSIGAVIPPTYQKNFLVACAAASSLHLAAVSAQSGPPDAKSNPEGWCYTMTTDPATQIAATFNYLHQKYGYSTFDMVYDQTNGYVSFQKPNIEAAATAGNYTLNEIGVDGTNSDFSPQITSVLRDNPDATFPFLTIEDGARFMQQARLQSYSAPFFDPVSQLTSQRLISLSGGAAVGLIASTPQSASDIPSFQSFLNTYQQTTGNALDDPTYTGFGYDALNAIAAAMNAAETSTDRNAIQSAITKLPNPCFSICFATETGGAFLAAKFYFVKLGDSGFVPDE